MQELEASSHRVIAESHKNHSHIFYFINQIMRRAVYEKLKYSQFLRL